MGSGFSTYIIDLRSRTESADRIHQLSFNDTMTGLPNRIAFNERLAFDAAEAHEKAHKLAAFSIDLDGFKDVNDVFGHSAGDLLLIEVADRMRKLLGSGEFLARQSGDEFLGLQMSGNHPHDAQAFAERIAARSRSLSRSGISRSPSPPRSAFRSSRSIRRNATSFSATPSSPCTAARANNAARSANTARDG